MRGRIVRIVRGVIGALMLVMGVIWILQGVNLLPGSFMTGRIVWAYYGVPLAAVGAGLIWLSRRVR